MALSNKFGGLLLTTGNKSEYAVGYATIYGDMCGGYAPLKDLYKTEVFALARWRNTVGDRVIPQGVIDRPPSAELRENQKDQDSLPPYDVLDAILLRHVDQEQSRERDRRARASMPTPWTRCCGWCGSANGSGTRPRRGRRCRGARSAASGAIRSQTAIGGRLTRGFPARCGALPSDVATFHVAAAPGTTNKNAA